MSMLNALYSKTAEEKKAEEERSALAGTSVANKQSMPEPDELKLVGDLREKFKAEIDKRKAAGTEYPFFFGDMNMTRIVRGTDCKPEEAAKWITRFFETLDAEKIDDYVKSVQPVIDGEAPDGEVLVKCCGLDPETLKICHFNLSTKSKAKNGDIIWYIAAGDYDKKKLIEMEPKGWQNFIDAWRKLMIINTALLDKESAAQGRMVKYYLVMDMKYMSISGTLNKKYDEALDSGAAKFGEKLAAEQINKILVTNAPWWLANMYKACTKLLPERLTAKIAIFQEDDPALYSLIDEATCKGFFATRIGRAAGMTGEPTGKVEIAANGDFEYSVSVKQGQTIAWKFTVGASDIRFGGFAYWTGEEANADEADADTGAEVIVPQATVTAEDGEVEGEIELAADGIVMMRFDNYHAGIMGKSKTVSYEITLS